MCFPKHNTCTTRPNKFLYKNKLLQKTSLQQATFRERDPYGYLGAFSNPSSRVKAARAWDGMQTAVGTMNSRPPVPAQQTPETSTEVTGRPQEGLTGHNLNTQHSTGNRCSMTHCTTGFDGPSAPIIPGPLNAGAPALLRSPDPCEMLFNR